MDSPLHSDEKFRLLPIGALALIFVFAAPFFWREVELSSAAVRYAPENRDLREYYAPVYGYAYGAMREGRIPAWDPTRLCGTPLQSDPRVGLFQPLSAVFLLAPFPEAFAIHAFLCLALAGIGLVLFARSMGLSATAALFGGLCFVFSGAAAGAMSRPPLAAALVWLPLVFWSARTLARRPGASSAVFLGLTLAGMLLSGALAVFGTTVLIATGYVQIAAAIPSRRGRASYGRAVVGLIGAFVLCGFVSAVQLLPTVQLAMGLDDPASLARAVMPAGTLPGTLREAAAQVAVPEPGSLPSLINIGIVGAVFLPAAFLQRRRVVEGLFFASAGAALLLLAVLYGAQFPGYLPAYAIVYPGVLCVAAACALGADRIMRKRSGPGREWYWMGVGLVLSACVVVFLAGGALTRGYMTLVAGLVILLLVARRPWARVGLGLALCGLVWTNLLTSSRNVFGHPFEPAAARRTLSDPERPFDVESGRVAVVGDLRNRVRAANDRVWRVDGVGALLTRDQAAWWKALTESDEPSGVFERVPNLDLLGAMAGRVVLAGSENLADDEDARWVTSSLGRRYISNPAAAPRAMWVPAVEWVDDANGAIASIKGGRDGVARIDSRHLNEAHLAGLDEDAVSQETDATASIQDRSAEHVVVTVKTPARGVLVLADSYSPDWFVDVDGRPATLLQANGMFRGVAVPEGDHIVAFQYRPAAFRMGSVVSIGTLALLALWGLIRVFR